MNKIYNYLTFLYANFSFFFEELFLKRKEHCNVEKSDILKKGFQEITFPKDFKINFNLHNSLKVNKYLDKIILTQIDVPTLRNRVIINRITKQLQ